MSKIEKWQSFTSLVWYDGLIEFIFRFVAKTSEPLLAAGLVLSAADFLSKGALMHGNIALSISWAWTQAIAIEASSGVVFVYGLQSFKERDKVKAWTYIVLSILLAITGGAMLFLQFMNNTTGLVDNALPAWVTDTLGCLRVVVSIGYVFMCRAKHIQFSGLFSEPSQPALVSPVPVQQPDFEEVIERLETMYSERLAVMIEQVTERVTVTIEQNTLPRLPAIAEGTRVQSEPVQKVQKVKEVVPVDGSMGTKVQGYIEQQLNLGHKPTLQEIMDGTGCSKGTAIKYRKGEVWTN